MKLPSRPLVLTAVLFASLVFNTLSAFAHRNQTRKPNVILIVADDLGYGELGAQGNREIPAPNIDSIAKSGVRFTNGYVSCPVCSPTRAGLMTGRYQQRFGHEFNPGPELSADERFGLSLKEATIAERLKSAGYATGMVGKWHLGYRSELTPPKRGFESFYGFLGGAHPYIKGGGARRASAILRGTEKISETEYLTDAFKREASDFIQKHKDQPFFLYMPFNAVHAPLQATEKYRARFPGIKTEKRLTFAAMLSAMDDAVGEILKQVRDAGIEDNTLILFLSDNGGPTRQTSSGNGPLRGFKGSVWEGGIRVPFMMQWKGRIPAGRTYDNSVISLDLHPTILAAAGIKVDAEWKLDGVNLLPFVESKAKGTPHDALFWRFGEQHAVRVGDWKMLVQPGSAPQLYHLKRDIAESTDLAGKEPVKLKELSGVYANWNKQMIAPAWKREAGQ